MNWAILENNIVKNVIVADETFIATHYPDAILLTKPCGVGWTFDGNEFTAPVCVLTPWPEPTEEIN